MTMELSFSVISDKDANCNTNLNVTNLHPYSKTKYISKDEEMQQSKWNETPDYSTLDMPIYESVQAVLRKEVYELLKLEVDNELPIYMKNYSEPFEVSELEDGHLTFTGTLKAILLCQQILFSFLKNSDVYQNHTLNKDEKDDLSHYEISFSRNDDSVARRKSLDHKISTVITIPPTIKRSTCVKSEHPLIGLRIKKKLNQLKFSYQTTDNGIESEKITKQQKICLKSNYDSESASIKRFESTSAFQASKILDSNNSCAQEIVCKPSIKSIQSLGFINDVCSITIPKPQFTKHQTYSPKSFKSSKRSKVVKFECGMCNGILNSTTVMPQNKEQLSHSIGHQKRGSVDDWLTCELCNFKSRHKREYKVHMDSVHAITYSCPQCSYRTTTKGHYIRHVRNVHENKRPYCCQLCGVAFKRCDALKQHQVVHFKDSTLSSSSTPSAPYKCNICKKIVRSASYLREHMLTHSEERAFLCEVCGASFKTRAVHRNHLKVVHSQMRCICRSCGKTFSTSYSLKRHTRQHETKGRKQIGKIRLWKKQPSSENGWVPLLFGSNLLTSGSSVPIAVAEKEEVVSLAKSDLILPAGVGSRNDKIIPPLYVESPSSENIGITVDSQIPYVIQSTNEINSD